MSVQSSKVKLTSSDNETFEVDIDVAKMSQLLRSMIESKFMTWAANLSVGGSFLVYPISTTYQMCSMLTGLGFLVFLSLAVIALAFSFLFSGSGTEDEIPVPNVKSKTLKKVVEYCTMHKDSTPPEIEKPLKSTNLADAGVSEQDLKFLEMDMESLFELILVIKSNLLILLS